MSDKQNKSNWSIKEVGQIFSEIDKKIISLYKCSSDDFVTFNNQLKKYHNQINIVSANAAKVSQLCLDSSDNGFISDVNAIIGDVNKHLDNIDTISDNAITHFEKLLKNVNTIMLYVRNYKQNLLTFKYLLTNMKFSVAYLNSNDTDMKAAFDSMSVLEKQTGLLNEFSNNLNHFKTAVYDFSILLRKSVKGNIDNLRQFISRMDASRVSTESNTRELKNIIEKLNEKIDACSENVGQIITHLQFQDIVRQKMEHIQEMHKEVLSITEKFEDTEIGQLSGIKQARFLIQVRDVAEMQMAQLSHTNHQYQKAIELISKRFLTIIENMTDATLLNVIFPMQSNKNGNYTDKSLESTLSHTTELVIKQEADIKTAVQDIRKVSESFSNVSVSLDSVRKMNGKIVQFALGFIDSIQESGLNTYDQKNVLDHLNNLIISNKNFSLLNITGEHLNKLLGQVLMITGRLDTSAKENLVKNFNQKAQNIIEGFSKNSKNIHKCLQENESITSAMIDEIFTSMQDVRYYDLFEKVIEDIINQLNEIHFQIASGGKSGTKNKIKTTAVQRFRELYTMESERQIHAGIISEESIKSLELQQELEEEQSNGDIELF